MLLKLALAKYPSPQPPSLSMHTLLALSRTRLIPPSLRRTLITNRYPVPPTAAIERVTPLLVLWSGAPADHPRVLELASELSGEGYDTTLCTASKHEEFTNDVQAMYGAIPPHVFVSGRDGLKLVLKYSLSWPLASLITTASEEDAMEEGEMEGVDVVPCFWRVRWEGGVKDVLDRL